MNSAQSPPPRPWPTGEHEDYTAFRLLVTVAERNGWVFSEHGFLGPADEKAANGMSSSGTRQIAYALLKEAMLREVFFEALILQSEDKEFLAAYAAADPDKKRQIESRLFKASRKVVLGTLDKWGPNMVRGVLGMMASSSGK